MSTEKVNGRRLGARVRRQRRGMMGPYRWYRRLILNSLPPSSAHPLPGIYLSAIVVHCLLQVSTLLSIPVLLLALPAPSPPGHLLQLLCKEGEISQCCPVWHSRHGGKSSLTHVGSPGAAITPFLYIPSCWGGARNFYFHRLWKGTGVFQAWWRCLRGQGGTHSPAPHICDLHIWIVNDNADETVH